MTDSAQHLAILRQAIQLHQNNQSEEASKLYWQILAEDPDHPDALHLAALLAYDGNRLSVAWELVTHAIRVSPEHPYYGNTLGLVLEAQGQTDEAIAEFEKVIAQIPDGWDAYTNLASIYIKKQEFRKALRLLKIAQRYAPEAIVIFEMLGELYQAVGKVDKVKSTYQKLLQMMPNHRESVSTLAELHANTGESEVALNYYIQLMALDPENIEVLNTVGWYLITLGRGIEAMGPLRRILSLDSQNLKAIGSMVKREHLLRLEESLISSSPNPQDLPRNVIIPNDSPNCDVVILSACLLYEQGGGQQPVQIARSLQQMGHNVMFIQGFSNQGHQEAFRVFEDLFLANQNYGITDYQKQLFRQVLASFTQNPEGQRIAVFSIFHPYLIDLVPIFQEFGYQTVYWCLDDWQEIGNPRLTREKEVRLVQAVDTVFATSQNLSRKMETFSPKPCPVIANGLDRAHFPRLGSAKPPVPEDMRFGKQKTLMYWGNLSAHWIDWLLCFDLAKHNPDWGFNLIGNQPLDMEEYRLENMFLLGEKKVQTLYPYGCHADIGIIFFKDNQLIQAVNPVKAYEYLACGLPIVTTPMCELDSFPYTYQVHNAQEFEQAVAMLEHLTIDQNVIEDFLENATWEARAQAMLDAVLKKNPRKVILPI